MKQILIATHNPAKLKELSFIFNNLINNGFKILSLKDLNINKQPQETGTTFKENAYLKATFYAQLAKIPTISDDGGLGIDILKGEPGVKSRNWLGYEATDEELIKHTLEILKGKPIKKRLAYLETWICFYDPRNKKSFFNHERISGYIAKKPSRHREMGYPFRSLFKIKIREKYQYYDSLNLEKCYSVNHRIKAARALLNKINKYLLK